MNPLHSVGARLSLALLLVVVGALTLVYLAVAPSLDPPSLVELRRLTNAVATAAS